MTDAKRMEELIREEFKLEIADDFEWNDDGFGECHIGFLHCWLALPDERHDDFSVNLADDESNFISITYRNSQGKGEEWMVSKIREVFQKYMKLREENYWFSVCTITGEEER